MEGDLFFCLQRSDVGKIFAYGLGLQKPVSGKNNFTVNCTGAGTILTVLYVMGEVIFCSISNESYYVSQ